MLEILSHQLIRVLQAMEDDEALKEAFSTYGHFSKVQMIQLDQALKEKQFSTAIEIGQQGLKLAMREQRYRAVLLWQRKLLQISIDQGNLENQKKYTYQIYLSERLHDEEIYNGLKRLHGAYWPNVLERLIDELQGDNQDNIIKLAKIFTVESKKSALLKLLQQQPRLVNSYGAPLHRAFPSEILEVYREHLEDFLGNYVGRNYYRRFCRELNRIAGSVPGGHEFARGMIIRMRQEYKLRKALVQELNKLATKYGIE